MFTATTDPLTATPDFGTLQQYTPPTRVARSLLLHIGDFRVNQVDGGTTPAEYQQLENTVTPPLTPVSIGLTNPVPIAGQATPQFRVNVAYTHFDAAVMNAAAYDEIIVDVQPSVTATGTQANCSTALCGEVYNQVAMSGRPFWIVIDPTGYNVSELYSTRNIALSTALMVMASIWNDLTNYQMTRQFRGFAFLQPDLNIMFADGTVIDRPYQSALIQACWGYYRSACVITARPNDTLGLIAPPIGPLVITNATQTSTPNPQPVVVTTPPVVVITTDPNTGDMHCTSTTTTTTTTTSPPNTVPPLSQQTPGNCNASPSSPCTFPNPNSCGTHSGGPPPSNSNTGSSYPRGGTRVPYNFGNDVGIDQPNSQSNSTGCYHLSVQQCGQQNYNSCCSALGLRTQDFPDQCTITQDQFAYLCNTGLVGNGQTAGQASWRLSGAGNFSDQYHQNGSNGFNAPLMSGPMIGRPGHHVINRVDQSPESHAVADALDAPPPMRVGRQKVVHRDRLGRLGASAPAQTSTTISSNSVTVGSGLSAAILTTVTTVTDTLNFNSGIAMPHPILGCNVTQRDKLVVLYPNDQSNQHNISVVLGQLASTIVPTNRDPGYLPNIDVSYAVPMDNNMWSPDGTGGLSPVGLGDTSITNILGFTAAMGVMSLGVYGISTDGNNVPAPMQFVPPDSSVNTTGSSTTWAANGNVYVAYALPAGGTPSIVNGVTYNSVVRQFAPSFAETVPYTGPDFA